MVRLKGFIKIVRLFWLIVFPNRFYEHISKIKSGRVLRLVIKKGFILMFVEMLPTLKEQGSTLVLAQLPRASRMCELSLKGK